MPWAGFTGEGGPRASFNSGPGPGARITDAGAGLLLVGVAAPAAFFVPASLNGGATGLAACLAKGRFRGVAVVARCFSAACAALMGREVPPMTAVLEQSSTSLPRPETRSLGADRVPSITTALSCMTDLRPLAATPCFDMLVVITPHKSSKKMGPRELDDEPREPQQKRR